MKSGAVVPEKEQRLWICGLSTSISTAPIFSRRIASIAYNINLFAHIIYSVVLVI